MKWILAAVVTVGLVLAVAKSSECGIFSDCSGKICDVRRGLFCTGTCACFSGVCQ